MITIKKGLNLPIVGGPSKEIDSLRKSKQVALIGLDYKGMRPTMLVKEGDSVKVGQPLFEDKKTPGVIFTSPASGKINAINRGEKRVFQSMIVDVDGDDHFTFSSYKDGINSRPEIQKLLVESGLWPSFRTRPFSKTPEIGSIPHDIFITAIDTNPLAADTDLVIKQHKDDFLKGVGIISKLTDGTTFVSKQDTSSLSVSGENVKVVDFKGVHPAGNVGTHMHFLSPVSSSKTNWSINYQDVIAIGKLFSTGKLWNERIISIAGPSVKNPRHITVCLGSKISEILENEFEGTNARVISGSVLSGRAVSSSEFDFLGKYHTQISVLTEGNEREFLGWHSPGINKFSNMRIYLSQFIPGKLFKMNTGTHGSARAMVPVGAFEKVMPLDILPTQLLRSLVTNDTDNAVTLGCLELDEEDLALCTFVSPGKVDFGPMLRENLTIIEKEG